MSSLSLGKSKARNFPCEIGGFPIDANFRNILKIMRMISDPAILPRSRPRLLAKWFFTGDAPPDAAEVFRGFLLAGASPAARQREPRLDFEFDADEIYADFLSVYGIDLIETEFLHWRKFLTLLAALPPDGALGRKIRLRFADLKDFKGSDLSDMLEAKEAVLIPVKRTREELKELKAFEAEWGGL
jgi:hypothetical protein